MIKEYFENDDVKMFFEYLQNDNAQDAIDMYLRIVKSIAIEKWLPENFAINQSIDILKKYGVDAIR